MTALYEKDLGFEEIVKKCDFSRGTINKYLNELYKEKLIKQQTARDVIKERRRKYYLSKKGKTYAGKLFFREKADVTKAKSCVWQFYFFPNAQKEKTCCKV